MKLIYYLFTLSLVLMALPKQRVIETEGAACRFSTSKIDSTTVPMVNGVLILVQRPKEVPNPEEAR